MLLPVAIATIKEGAELPSHPLTNLQQLVLLYF